MILSKAALQIVGLTKADKHVPIMDQVLIEPDGTLVATNGRVIALVSPVVEKVRESVPLPWKSEAETFGERIVLSSESVRTVLKAVPRDTRFRGILEHCAIRLNEPEGTKVEVSVTDGKRTQVLTLRRAPTNFLRYEDVLREALGSRLLWEGEEEGRASVRTIMNRKRLKELVETVDKICPYKGDFSPTYWEFTRARHTIIRARNELTDQRIIAVFGYLRSVDGEWLEENEWEREKGGSELYTIIEERCPICKNHMRKEIAGTRVECSYVNCPTRRKRKAIPLNRPKRKAVKL